MVALVTLLCLFMSRFRSDLVLWVSFVHRPQSGLFRPPGLRVFYVTAKFETFVAIKVNVVFLP
jgi:hypothetical protein